jgi:preprotein translocase subunit SecD
MTGGSQAILKLESSTVTMTVYENDLTSAWGSIWRALDNDWVVSLISTNQENLQIVFGIGGPVNEEYLDNLVGVYGRVVSVETKTSETIQNRVATALKNRLDPYGVLGFEIRIMGDNQILVESTADVSSIMHFLVKEGRLDLVVDGQLAVTNAEMISVGRAASVENYGRLSVYFSENGRQGLSSAVYGRAGEQLQAYLDRPFDAILIYDPGLLFNLSSFTYDENALTFYEATNNYPIAVPILQSVNSELSSEARGYLENKVGEKNRVILLGSERFFTDNLKSAIPSSYKIEYVEKQSGEKSDDWLTRACGLTSSFPISADLAENGLTGTGISIVISGGLQSAKDLRTVLISRLPTRVTFVEQTTVESQVGSRFTRSTMIACLFGMVAISLFTYYWHRRMEVSISILGMLMCELIIVLGTASVMHLSIGLVEIMSIFAVVNVGLAQLIIITNEMVGGAPTGKKVSIAWRAPKALNLTYSATFFVVIAMLAMVTIGASAVLSFIIIFAVGILLSVLLVNPVYARVLDQIYSKQATVPSAPKQ